MDFKIVGRLLERLKTHRKCGFLKKFVKFCGNFRIDNDKQDYYALYGDSVLSSEVIRLLMDAKVEGLSSSIGAITQIKSYIVSNESLGSLYDDNLINKKCSFEKVGKRRADYIEAVIGYISLRRVKESGQPSSIKYSRYVEHLVVEIIIHSLNNLKSNLTTGPFSSNIHNRDELMTVSSSSEEEEEELEEFGEEEEADFDQQSLFESVKELLEQSQQKTMNFKTIRFYLSCDDDENLHRVNKQDLEKLIRMFPNDFKYSGNRCRGISLTQKDE